MNDLNSVILEGAVSKKVENFCGGGLFKVKTFREAKVGDSAFVSYFNEINAFVTGNILERFDKLLKLETKVRIVGRLINLYMTEGVISVEKTVLLCEHIEIQPTKKRVGKYTFTIK